VHSDLKFAHSKPTSETSQLKSNSYQPERDTSRLQQVVSCRSCIQSHS